MKSTFDEVIDRKNTYSEKWNVKENELPMWIADMDFKTAPGVIEALEKRVQNGIFGYSYIPEEWYDCYIDWWKKYHSFTIQKEWLIFTTGVVAAISSMVRRLTEPAENVVVQTPVYNIFFNSILNNGRNVLENKLLYQDGKYTINFEDLEAKLSYPQTTLMILCNPHNPIGKIWSKEELQKIGELCYKYHVKVISDEIHCDITDPNQSYIPFASVSKINQEISVTCLAPSKAFNLAGVSSAALVIPSTPLYNKVNRGLNNDEVAEPNAFSIAATLAAFQKGRPWLEELKEYIYQNKLYVKKSLEDYPEVYLVPSNATYLLWLDCQALHYNSDELQKEIRNRTGLYLSSGSAYHANGCFLRMNIACPRTMLEDGIQRFKDAIRQLRK